MSENINKMMQDLKISTQQEITSRVKVDYFEILHDAYIRYNYILENVDFKTETLFVKNNIKTFIDHFIEYKMDTFLLYKFVENIDRQIELELFYGSI